MSEGEISAEELPLRYRYVLYRRSYLRPVCWEQEEVLWLSRARSSYYSSRRICVWSETES
jgi:hypothetical protein